jgi:hypothetical protein
LACVFVVGSAARAGAQSPPLSLAEPEPQPSLPQQAQLAQPPQPEPEADRPGEAAAGSPLDTAGAEPVVDPAALGEVASEARLPLTSEDQIDPSQLPVESAPQRAPYPRSLVERTLLLPPGRSEITVAVGLGHENASDIGLLYGAVSIDGRFAVGRFEPAAGIYVVPLYGLAAADAGDVEVPLVQRLFAGTKLRIADETALAIQERAMNIDSVFRGVASRLFAEHRFRTSDRGAIQLGGGIEYIVSSQPGWYVDRVYFHHVSAFATAARTAAGDVPRRPRGHWLGDPLRARLRSRHGRCVVSLVHVRR